MQCPDGHAEHEAHEKVEHEKAVAAVDDDLLLNQDFSEWPGDDFHSATMAEAAALWPSGVREDGTEYGMMKCNAKGVAEGRLLLGKGRMEIKHKKGTCALHQSPTALCYRVREHVSN